MSYTNAIRDNINHAHAEETILQKAAVADTAHTEAETLLPACSAKGQTVVLEVSAAYNLDGLPMPKPNGPNGKRVLNMEMLMSHPVYWSFLNERETEEVLMELYIARTRRAQ